MLKIRISTYINLRVYSNFYKDFELNFSSMLFELHLTEVSNTFIERFFWGTLRGVRYTK